MAESTEETKCGICWEKITPHNKVVTPCNHHYCTSCFFQWMKKKGNCPACRKDFGTYNVKDREELLQEINTYRREHRQLCKKNRYLSKSNNELIRRNTSLRKMVKKIKFNPKRIMPMQAIKGAINYRREWEQLYGHHSVSN